MLINSDKICEVCSRATRERLAEIPVLYLEASAYLEPGRGGFGSSGSERTIGVNLAALGFRQAGEVLTILEDWERTVRVKSLGQVELDGQDRGDTPMKVWSWREQKLVDWKPGEEEWANERPVVRVGTTEERVQGVCEFLMVHARWLAKYEAAGDWYSDVAAIHGQGNAATRRFAEKVTQIKCPGSVEIIDGENEGEVKTSTCGKILTLDESPLAPIKCKRCGREWTTWRLIKVALDTPGYVFWLDSEAIASLLGITANHVAKIVKKFNVKDQGKRGKKVYDLMEINSLRAKGGGE